MKDKTTPPPRLALTLDMEKYLGQLESWDIPDEQACEIILTVWGLLVTAAEISHGIGPVQQAQKTCGQLEYKSIKPALTAPDRLYLESNYLSENFITHSEKHENEKSAP